MKLQIGVGETKNFIFGHQPMNFTGLDLLLSACEVAEVSRTKENYLKRCTAEELSGEQQILLCASEEKPYSFSFRTRDLKT
jgi:hypothetical protein